MKASESLSVPVSEPVPPAAEPSSAPLEWNGAYTPALRQAYKSLLAAPHTPESLSLFHSLKPVVRALFVRGGYNATLAPEQLLTDCLQVAAIALGELNLGSVSLASVVLFPPLSAGVLTPEELGRVAPQGTQELTRLLQETSAFFKQNIVQQEELQPFLLSVAKDVRVILILIAQNLYALRTAKERLPQAEQRAVALQAQGLFIPIAHRLGIYAVKGEMEDYVLKYTNPEAYYFIKDKLGQKKRERTQYMERFIAPLRSRLDAAPRRWPYALKSRTKTISSIHNKMLKKGIPFEQIYDLSAMRIILDTPPEEEKEACWYVYSIVTDLYKPNTKRLRDWITKPRDNGYESLQITVTGPDERSVEVQIRTRRMDDVAERGVAAHWRYKGIASREEIDATLTSVRQALEQVGKIKEGAGAALSVEPSRSIFAVTPAGALIKLPAGATVLDFAYAIHSAVGSTAMSAVVNGKKARLKDKLSNGDSVSIVTNKNQKPCVDWLSFVVTRKAAGHIRQSLREQQEKGLEAARELLERRFKNRRLEFDFSLFGRLLKRMHFKGNMEFFMALSEGKVNVNRFLSDYEELQQESLRDTVPPPPPQAAATPADAAAPPEGGDIIVVSTDFKGVEYSLAKCCHPQPGDHIFAYPTKNGLRIHSKQCPNAVDILGRHGDRVLPARWAGAPSDRPLYRVEVWADDKADLIAQILSTAKNSPDLSYSGHSADKGDSVWQGKINVSAAQKQAVYAFMAKLQALNGVRRVSLLE